MKFKYLGTISDEIVNFNGLLEHKNKPIIVYEDRIEHVIDRHLNEFDSKDEILLYYDSLDKIIKKPDFTFYNKKAKSIEYYKYFNKDICVAVRINEGKI